MKIKLLITISCIYIYIYIYRHTKTIFRTCCAEFSCVINIHMYMYVLIDKLTTTSIVNSLNYMELISISIVLYFILIKLYGTNIHFNCTILYTKVSYSFIVLQCFSLVTYFTTQMLSYLPMWTPKLGMRDLPVKICYRKPEMYSRSFISHSTNSCLHYLTIHDFSSTTDKLCDNRHCMERDIQVNTDVIC